MIMMPHTVLLPLPTLVLGRIIFQQGDLRLSSGKNLKVRNFGGVLSNFVPVPSGLTDRVVSKKQQQAVIAIPTERSGVAILRSAPSPVVPAGKLDTTRTVLPSGEALKKKNFVGVLSNFSPSFLPRLSAWWNATGRGKGPGPPGLQPF